MGYECFRQNVLVPLKSSKWPIWVYWLLCFLGGSRHFKSPLQWTPFILKMVIWTQPARSELVMEMTRHSTFIEIFKCSIFNTINYNIYICYSTYIIIFYYIQVYNQYHWIYLVSSYVYNTIPNEIMCNKCIIIYIYICSFFYLLLFDNIIIY